MSQHDRYISPFSTRYASDEMQYIFSDDNKFRTWRRLWVALARAEMDQGLTNITPDMVAELEAHVDDINYEVAIEREKLVDSLTGANNVLLSYVNVKIAELDGRKQELLARIAELTVEAISPEQVSQISGYLDTWENVSFDDKRRVVDLMITTVAATSDSLNITWKI